LFCPECGDEFRTGYSVCPDCGVSLISQRPVRGVSTAEAEEFVTVATFENQIEASVARGALEAEGIPTFVPIEVRGSYNVSRPYSPWAELKVRAGDRDRAIQVLKRAGHQ
jgi:hypothetical protein